MHTHLCCLGRHLHFVQTSLSCSRMGSRLTASFLLFLAPPACPPLSYCSPSPLLLLSLLLELFAVKLITRMFPCAGSCRKVEIIDVTCCVLSEVCARKGVCLRKVKRAHTGGRCVCGEKPMAALFCLNCLISAYSSSTCVFFENQSRSNDHCILFELQN